MSNNRYETIIVGGGIAGLTSAAYLARAGQKVLLIEKNDVCGGLVNSFSHNGFHFDAGVRALESAGIIFPMLEELGIELDVVKSPVSLGVKDTIIHFENLNSLVEYRDMLVKFFPQNEREIDKLIKEILKVTKHMEVLYGIENPIFKDLRNDREYLFKKLLPWLPKFIFTVGKINRMNMPIEDFLDTIITNQALKDVISQHFFKSTPAFFALSYISLFLDYYYPKGGVGKLADAVSEKIKLWGGEILTQTTITEVFADTHILKDANGISYEYDNLIWATDLKTLYTITHTQNLSQKIKNKFDSTKAKMLKSRGGDSIFSLFLEVDAPIESFKKIANGHFFYTPSLNGLNQTHREDLKNILHNWDTTTKEEIYIWLDRYVEHNTFEISIPALKDESLVPQGKSGIIVSFLAEFDLFVKLKESGWYDEFRENLEKKVLEVLSHSIFPDIKEKIINKFSFSPINIKDRIGSSEGGITGWTFERELPVVHKIQFSDRSVVTPIPSIFQAGQWAYSPAGVPMSILTGKLASERVLKRVKKHL